jgi:hypothetical protein
MSEHASGVRKMDKLEIFTRKPGALRLPGFSATRDAQAR